MTTNTTWATRHRNAWNRPVGCEVGVVGMIKSWSQYGEDHQTMYGSSIGGDYVLGEAWLEIAKALRTMLNGELGRLDGGTLDSFICERVTKAGWDVDTYERL